MAKRPANMSCPHCGGTLIPAHELCDYCQSANPYYQAPRPAATVYTPAYTPEPVYLAPTVYAAADTFGKAVIWAQWISVILVTLCLGKGSWMAGLYMSTGEMSFIFPILFLLYGTIMGMVCIAECIPLGCMFRLLLFVYVVGYFVVMGCFIAMHFSSYQIT